MLGTALFDKTAECEAVEKDTGLRRRKILAVIGAAPSPDGFEQPAYGPRIIMRCRRPAQPWRAAAGGDLLPCHPIDEEDDVASFFVYQRLEDVEHRFRQKAGAACNLEHAETEKRIEAFAIPEIGE